MDEKNKKPAQTARPAEDDSSKKNMTVEEWDKTADEADKERTRKPGSQSNSSDQHNNGRGGGK